MYLTESSEPAPPVLDKHLKVTNVSTWREREERGRKREGERGREGGRERERKGGRERGREREGGREGGRERERGMRD